MFDCKVLAFPFKLTGSDPGSSGVTGLDVAALPGGVSVPLRLGVPGLGRDEYD